MAVGDLSGVKVSTAVMWPGAIHEGNGKMAVFIDADSDDQREAIGKILMAEDGGMPWEILATTISEIRGPFFEKIEIEDNETDSKVRVGDKIVVEMETFKNPVTGDPHEVHTVMPNGFLFHGRARLQHEDQPRRRRGRLVRPCRQQRVLLTRGVVECGQAGRGRRYQVLTR
jgi:hypothetical protein